MEQNMYYLIIFIFKTAIKVQNISLEIRLSEDLQYLLYCEPFKIYISLLISFIIPLFQFFQNLPYYLFVQ